MSIVFQRILVATDFEAGSKPAIDLAIDLARSLGASLVLFHAYDVPSYAYAELPFTPVDLLTPIEQAAKKQLQAAHAALRERLPVVEAVMRRGSPWLEIVGAAKELRADLIVMGTHGRQGIKHALLGSVAEKVVRTSPVPVMTVGPQNS